MFSVLNVSVLGLIQDSLFNGELHLSNVEAEGTVDQEPDGRSL